MGTGSAFIQMLLQARGCFTTRLSAAGMPCKTLRNVLPESGMNVWRAMPHKPCHALQCLCSAVRCNATQDNALQCNRIVPG